MPDYLAAFPNTRAAVEAAVNALSADDAFDLDHGEVERRSTTFGTEFMRSLIQDHVDLRAEREKTTVEPMRGADSEERTEARPSQRDLGRCTAPSWSTGSRW